MRTLFLVWMTTSSRKLYAGRDPPTNDEDVDSASYIYSAIAVVAISAPQHTTPYRSRFQTPTSWSHHAIPLPDVIAALLSHGAPLAIQGSGSSDVRGREADPRVRSRSVPDN
jgi:hypothetical protein